MEMRSMESFELSIVIKRPAEEVFGFLANLENDLQWRREWVDARNMSDGSLSVGSKFRLTSELLGQRIPTVYQVIKYEPDRIAAWKAVSGPLPLIFQRTLERVEGGTRVTIRYEMDVRGFYRMVMSLIAGTVKRQHEGDLRKVKELMEARA
jgi:uncharacterized membrane protein